MAIPVTCPSCLKRFSVSDKFAGKSGPCPNCQKSIKIPEKADAVVIHSPDEAAPKDSKGKSILKPIRRTEVKLSLPVVLTVSLSTVAIFALAFGLGLSGGAPTLVLAIASVLLAAPLVFVGYWFLHDDELGSFQGRDLLVRSGICALIFAGSWGIYFFVPTYLTDDNQITGLEMIILVPIMIALGTTASVMIFEVELLQGMLHYAFYLGITFLLAWLAGAPLTGSVDSAIPVRRPPPTVNQPDQKPVPTSPTTPSVAPETPPNNQVPNILQ